MPRTTRYPGATLGAAILHVLGSHTICAECHAPAVLRAGWWQCDNRRCASHGQVIREARPDEVRADEAVA